MSVKLKYKNIILLNLLVWLNCINICLTINVNLFMTENICMEEQSIWLTTTHSFYIDSHLISISTLLVEYWNLLLIESVAAHWYRPEFLRSFVIFIFFDVFRIAPLWYIKYLSHSGLQSALQLISKKPWPSCRLLISPVDRIVIFRGASEI